MPPEPAVVYVVSRYPAPSHTFVLREVRALRESGVAVETVSIRRPRPEEVVAPVDVEEEASTFDLLPVGALRLLRAHLRLWRRDAGAYAATAWLAVRGAPPGWRAKLWRLFYLTEAVLLLEHCRRLGIRRLHAHFANVGADVCWLTAELGRRVEPDRAWTWSFTMHGPTEFFAVEEYNLRRKVEAADVVVCISEFCRSQLMRLVDPAGWDRLVVVHCGVDTERFSPGDPSPAEHGALEVLCIGRLCAEKGQVVLLEAVAQLRDRDVDVRVVLAGGGPDRDLIERRRQELGLEPVVGLLGVVGQDRLPDLVAGADVLCLPSFAEGVPIVLMEAMASGVPVVTTPVGGIPELVADGRSGVLVAPGRADLLADALAALATDRSRRARLGAGGREAVLAGFDLRRNAAALRRVLFPEALSPPPASSRGSSAS